MIFKLILLNYMTTKIKSNSNYAVFLSNDDLFYHEILTDKHSNVIIPKLNIVNTHEVFDDTPNIYKREIVGYNKMVVDDYGQVTNTYQKYILYVHNINISLLSEQEITQIFEICKSLKYGNYFNIRQIRYGKYN